MEDSHENVLGSNFLRRGFCAFLSPDLYPAGLFEWSIKNQDTSRPQNPSKVRQIPEEDRKWFQEAMEAHTEDVYKRLRGVKEALESKADTPEDVDEKLRLLENLTEIVENIDYAKGELFHYVVHFAKPYTVILCVVSKLTAI